VRAVNMDESDRALLNRIVGSRARESMIDDADR
jgi:hypothetical protein